VIIGYVYNRVLLLVRANYCLQLEDGDIICYQKTLNREEEERYRYPDVPQFLEYVRNRQVIAVTLHHVSDCPASVVLDSCCFLFAASIEVLILALQE
jgi:hypothetical protein